MIPPFYPLCGICTTTVALTPPKAFVPNRIRNGHKDEGQETRQRDRFLSLRRTLYDSPREEVHPWQLQSFQRMHLSYTDLQRRAREESGRGLADLTSWVCGGDGIVMVNNIYRILIRRILNSFNFWNFGILGLFRFTVQNISLTYTVQNLKLTANCDGGVIHEP